MTDSEKGDDLVGLLESWAGCLLAFAGAMDPGNFQEREKVVKEALGHLNSAISMEVTATKAMNTVGDCYVFLSENAAVGGPSATPQRVKLLEDALSLGYRRALSVNRNDLDGSVGVAETHFQLAKLYREAGDLSQAHANFSASAQKYTSIAGDQELWMNFGSVHERSDHLYNCACALAQLGDQACLAQACQAIQSAMTFGTINPDLSEIKNDPDLHPILPHLVGTN